GGAQAAAAAGAPWPKLGAFGRADPWGPGLAALVEEPLFRGLILTGFLARYARGRAILLNGLVFALAHLNVDQLLVPLVLGLFYAWVAAETGSIVLPLLGHLGHNLAGVALARLDEAGRDLARAWAPVTACLAPILAVGALLLLRRSLASGRRPTAPPRPPAR
ncbi:MAG: CPBP family intramembrane metalloprotease, partial [Anaeromyxobacteraceae bacterium]|nr:CPBP family intramembrane metalloprotease [Anaeromyxobacteraceae bacterium]